MVLADPADAERLGSVAGVTAIAPNIEVWPMAASPQLANALAMTGADLVVSQRGFTGAGLVVGIIDTGVKPATTRSPSRSATASRASPPPPAWRSRTSTGRRCWRRSRRCAPPKAAPSRSPPPPAIPTTVEVKAAPTPMMPATPMTQEPPQDDGGCSCSSGRRASSPGLWLPVLGLLLAARKKRARDRKHGRELEKACEGGDSNPHEHTPTET